MQPVVSTDVLSISPSAVKAIRDLLTERNLVNHSLRVFVAGKTCSGYQYGMSLDENTAENDTAFESDGVKVIVDNASLEYLKGAKLDFIDDERGKGFLVDNPNVTACNCGSETSGCGSDSGSCC